MGLGMSDWGSGNKTTSGLEMSDHGSGNEGTYLTAAHTLWMRCGKDCTSLQFCVALDTLIV